MRILFMGTPDFALFSLKALCASNHTVVGVVTQPDKPKGRGYMMIPPPVKAWAAEQGLPVYQPETLKGPDFLALLGELAPDVIVVAAYGKILNRRVLGFPKYGCINVHGSLLPKYRGAAPMQRAILDGETETGVTIMKMAAGLDTGDMYRKVVVPIGENDNFETVHDAMGKAGASLLLTVLADLEAGIAVAEPQDGSLATYAEKIEKEDCLINFAASVHTVHNQIRGLSPIPLAFTHTPDGKLLKVTESRVSRVGDPGAAPGTVVGCGKTIEVACADGVVALLTVLPEGKKAMPAAAYLNGRKLAEGDRLI